MISSRKVFSGLILLLIAGLLSSCAGIQERQETDEELIRKRVTAYWDYRAKKEIDKMYEFEYPLYKKSTTLTNYIRQYSNPMLNYNSFEIVGINREGDDVADIRLKVNVRAKVPGAKAFEHDTFLTERWVRVDGEWYHVPRRMKRLTQ